MSARRGVWNSRNSGRTRMVARDLLARADGDISFGQIHRLLYLIEGYSLGLRGVALVRDTVLAGASGPEWPALFDPDGRDEVIERDNVPTFSTPETEVVDMVFSRFGPLTLKELNGITAQQWPVAERGIGEVVLAAELKVHFQDLLAAERVQNGERMPELIAFRYRSGTAPAVSGDGHGHPRGATSDGPAIELPEVYFESFDYFGTEDAATAIERYVLMALRLWEQGSEDFHPVARQTIQQLKRLRAEADRVEDEQDRREMLRRIGHCRGTLQFLTDYGPAVEGSGPVHPAGIQGTKIGSVSSGGLPGLGKR